MRRQRIEWLKQFFPFTREKRKRSPKENKVRAQAKLWSYELPNGVAGKVIAMTRSEARAEIKQAVGLKGRVPVGSMITQMC